jgi:hypothetical protein
MFRADGQSATIETLEVTILLDHSLHCVTELADCRGVIQELALELLTLAFLLCDRTVGQDNRAYLLVTCTIEKCVYTLCSGEVVNLPPLLTAMCHHIEQTISSPFGGSRFDPLGPTPFG